ncbi:hypothetical protein PYCCODRAFT_1358325 [Trametes coccinea BRFM310]|uniref:Uncharacterized protein n=1 Tax=Trametes coccinea (strain BRFM310) TaxID=1353009 RepID=A0A1Y2J4R2_TRAC3|nr:hypothetical protein PYCCODRAFT_1358325 [Trametes coccinea BRFM310]
MPDPERSITPSSADRRSVSRGREAFVRSPPSRSDLLPSYPPSQSSGRGGIGNMHRPSVDTASPTPPADEPLSPVRGREATVDPERAKSTGRGGMGNIRSGSRARSASQIPVPENYPQTASLVSDQAANIAEYEKYVVQQSEEAAKARARSSGRGGLGNIKSTSKSKSRSRSRVPHSPQVLSTGRGGVGNLQPGTNVDAELLAQLEEEERLRYAHEAGVHSTGRGGRANLTNLPSPPLEPVPPHAHEYEATGRGGAGNIRSRSASRGPGESGSRSRSASRGPSSSRDRGSSLARMLNKVGLHREREREAADDDSMLSPSGMTAVEEDVTASEGEGEGEGRRREPARGERAAVQE